MFTGLIKDVGKIINVTANTEGKLFNVLSNNLTPYMQIDDSVAINGVCQTITSVSGNTFQFQTIQTSLTKTTLGKLKSLDYVNLELAMKLSDRLGGHLVLGHVNDTAKIFKILPKGNSYLLTLIVPESLMPYMTKEGSVTCDGISLTISNVDRNNNYIEMSIIPHTWQSTCLKYKHVGDLVNIEADVIAKYLETLLLSKKIKEHKSKDLSNMTENWIRSQGF